MSRVFVSHSASRAVLLKLPGSTGNSLKTQTLQLIPGLLNKKFYGEGLLGDFESHCFEYCACVRVCMPSCFSQVRLSVTLWTVACQAPLSVGFSRQEYWSGVPFPLSGDLPNPGIKSISLESPALVGGFFTTEPPGKPFPLTLISNMPFSPVLLCSYQFTLHPCWGTS